MKFIVIVVLIIIYYGVKGNRKGSYEDIKSISRLKLNDGKIYGGDEVKPHSIPYQVALYITSNTDAITFCGGSLISANYVLTAAHCLFFAQSVKVVLGAHQLDAKEAQIHLNTTDFTMHQDFIYTIANDIAVIKLPETVGFTENIQPVQLPARSDSKNMYVNDRAIVSGWGRTEADTERSDVLLKIDTLIIANDLCAYFLGEKVQNDFHICTSGVEYKAPCNGDSGGPLTIDGVQVGIVSFGFALGCSFGFPNGYTRITNYLDWIEEHTNVYIK